MAHSSEAGRRATERKPSLPPGAFDTVRKAMRAFAELVSLQISSEFENTREHEEKLKRVQVSSIRGRM